MSGQAELWKQQFVHHSAPSLLCTSSGVVHTINDVGLSLLGGVSVNATLQSMFGGAAASLQAVFGSLKENVVTTQPVVFQHQVYKAEVRLLGEDVWIRLCVQEAQVDQETRLRSLGALSGGLFHAIRNPLTIVQGRVELMQMITTDERTQSTLQIVYEQCSRIAEMLDNTQQITLQPVQQTQFSLNMLLRKVFSETKGINLEDLTVVSVLNDENRLRIALETIAEHINHSGALSEVSIHRQSNQVLCTLHCDLDDDGMRFFRDVQNTVRTKKQVQFTSSTREQHIQMLSVIFSDCAADFEVSNTGCISITFMNVEQEIGNLKILVVDDDDILRETVVALLSLQGHHILTANTAEEAKLLWDEHIDVVLLDVNLPKMSGVDLLSEIQAEHPLWVRRTILISGIGSFAHPLGVRFLQKPFSKRQLNEAIEQIMHK